MTTDLTLYQAVAAGEILATHRGVDYVRVCAVFALPHDAAEAPSFYALERDWPTTHVGEVAAKEAEIADLKRRIAELEHVILTEPDPPPALPPPPRSTARSTAKGGQITGGTELRVRCEVCGNRIWPRQLAKHLARHAPPAALPNAAPPRTAARYRRDQARARRAGGLGLRRLRQRRAASEYPRRAPLCRMRQEGSDRRRARRRLAA